MIDWYCVNYLYPDAFQRFDQIMFPNIGIMSISTLEYYDLKKLYRFFDKEGIYLTIEMYKPDQWGFTISTTNDVVLGLGSMSKSTREEIEAEGFQECFKILENKLNK